MAKMDVLSRVYNINKPKGITSHDVVSKMRKILKTKKVGHTGTLDPDATGVLPICVGRATKVSNLILEKNKEYICEMMIGIETDTYDVSGNVLSKTDTSMISIEGVENAIKTQIGDIDQYPPIYSALKINGRKMCDLVREGRADEIVLKPRRIKIFSIDIMDHQRINYQENECILVKIRVFCSKGTYIRSICHDVGEILKTGATMYSLIRTKSGIFNIEDSISLEELESMANEDKLESKSYTIEEVLSEFDDIILNENAVKYYSNGGRIGQNRFRTKKTIKKDMLVRTYSPRGEFIGVGKIIEGEGGLFVKSEKIFNQNN